MKIVAARSWLETRDYRRPFVIAGGASPSATNVLVALTGEDGTVGHGEAAPMTAYSGETAEGVRHALEEFFFPLVIGLDPLDLESLHDRLDRRLQGHSFAKAALDFACYDLVGKTLGLPVYQLLGGRMRDRIPLAWAVGLGTVDEMVEEAVRYAKAGFPTIKLKIGVEPQRDLEMLREVRRALGPGVPVRVDANQGYDFVTACRVLPKMEEQELQLIEQPIHRWNIDGMAELCRMLETPIMADESLYSLQDAGQLARRGAADIFNIKLLKPGGLWRSRQVAAVAEAFGIPCLVGSMPEMGVGTLAGVHFAASCRVVTFPSELIGPLMFAGDVLAGNPLGDLERVPGWITVPEAPGLGVALES
jgi:L-Ala-D/L-Glu epimerase / N-acetyl-D-glutamate racemase